MELPKFTKIIDDLSSIREKWAYFFKHAEETSEEDLLRLVGDDVILLRAYKELSAYSWSEIELNTYEQERKRELDAKAIIEQQLIDTEEKGKAEGLAEGEAKILVMKQAMARKLLDKGLSLDEIAVLTELPIVDIEQLSANSKDKSNFY